MTTLSINGKSHTVSASADTPLLYVLRGELDVMTPKFGCGLAQCGACSVLVDGVETRACITPIMALEGKAITTVEGLPARWQAQKTLDDDPLLLMIDIDIVFTREAIERVRLNVIKGRQIWYPVVFR